MIFPTKTGQIRNDSGGFGYYGAPRGNRKHKGVDFSVEPGEPVFSPCSGVVKRRARPYVGDKHYDGCLIEAKAARIKIFYLNIEEELIGQVVRPGQIIGYAQDISKKYSAVTPHIHLEISSVDPMRLIDRDA